jgi:hypothetical protein
MKAEFKFSPSEIEENWIMSLKELFKGQTVELKVTIESLDTDKARQARFKKAVEDVRKRSNLVSFTLEEFKAHSKKLLAAK